MGFFWAVEETEMKDFRDDESGIGGAVHAVIGELVGRNALCMELAKTGFIAKKRPAGHSHAAREERFDGRVEPNDGNILRAEKFRSALLRVSSTAEGEYNRFFGFRCAAKNDAELFRLKRAEGRFTKAFEELRDAKSGRFLDTLVEVNKTPGELARK